MYRFSGHCTPLGGPDLARQLNTSRLSSLDLTDNPGKNKSTDLMTPRILAQQQQQHWFTDDIEI